MTTDDYEKDHLELYSCKICRGSGFDFIFDDLESYNSHILTEHPDSI